MQYFNTRKPVLHQDFPLINMVAGEKRKTKTKLNTVEPRYNEGPRDWQNLLTITRFRYIEVLFHIVYYYWDKEIVLYTEDFAI